MKIKILLNFFVYMYVHTYIMYVIMCRRKSRVIICETEARYEKRELLSRIICIRKFIHAKK